MIPFGSELIISKCCKHGERRDVVKFFLYLPVFHFPSCSTIFFFESAPFSLLPIHSSVPINAPPPLEDHKNPLKNGRAHKHTEIETRTALRNVFNLLLQSLSHTSRRKYCAPKISKNKKNPFIDPESTF